MRPRDFGDYRKLRRIVRNPFATLRFLKRHRAGQTHAAQMNDGLAIFLRGARADAHMFDRIFLRDEYRVGAQAASGFGTVVDLGGNVGLFAARMALCSERVISYEPYPVNFDCLEQNTGGRPNVEAVCGAVAGATGTLRLYHPRSEQQSGVYSAYQEMGGHMSDAYDDVPAWTLAEVFERHRIERCDLLKLDVEGAEYGILHAAPPELLARVNRIHAEYHDVAPDDPRTRVDAFAAFLEQAGYAIERAPHARKPNHGMLFAWRKGAAPAAGPLEIAAPRAA